MIGLLVGRILMRVHIRAEPLNRLSDERGSVTTEASKFPTVAKGQIQNVVEDKHLTVALGTSPDANGRSADFPRDHCCHFARNSFQEQTGHTRAIKRDSVTLQLFNTADILSLHLVPAHDVD